MSKAHPQSGGRKRSAIRRWLPLILLLAAVLAVWASGLDRYLTLAGIADHRDLLKDYVATNWLTALAIYLAVYVAAIAFSLPGGALLTILGGFLFGWFIGGLATVVSATCGATVIFLIARSSFGAFLAERAGPRARAFAEGFRKDAFNYLLFLRLVPLFPFWLVNIAPALFNVGLGTYVSSTFIGIIPATFAFSMLGSGLDSIVAAQRAAYVACVEARGAGDCSFGLDAGALVTPQLVAAFAALGVMAVIPVIYKRLKAQRATAAPGPRQGNADADRP